MTITVHNYRPRHAIPQNFEWRKSSSGFRDMGSLSLAAARPTEPWGQHPSSPEGWGVKTFQSEVHGRERYVWWYHDMEGDPPVTGVFHWWIPSMASNVELWYFLCGELEKAVEQRVELLLIWDTLIWRNLMSKVSCQKGPTWHAYAWQTGPFGRIPSMWRHRIGV